MVVSEGMELVVVFIALLIALAVTVWIQKWSGLT
jgi:hypothetical protein